MLISLALCHTVITEEKENGDLIYNVPLIMFGSFNKHKIKLNKGFFS